MSSEFRCAKCIHSVLTGILPNGVSEYACISNPDAGPMFIYDANPSRVVNCMDFVSNRSVRPYSSECRMQGRGHSFYELDNDE